MTTSTTSIPSWKTIEGAPPTCSAASVGCAHCGLCVPSGLIEEDCSTQFCCQGCRAAYEIIRGCGLERYYHVRDAATGTRNAVKSSGKRYRELDDQHFASLYCTPLPNGAMSVELFLEGVHCAACVWLVERIPAIVPGVVACRLDPRRSLVHVTWEPAKVRLSEIAHTMDSLGYAPHPARDAAARTVRRLDDRRTLIRLGVAGACAGNVMLLALALYAGVFDSMDVQYLRLFRWTSMLISLVSLAWPGSVFFRGAWASIRTRTAHLDLPISIGLGTGAIWGIINTVRGTGEIYFDSLSVLIFVLLIGRAIQHRQQRWSADAVELLFSLTPSSVHRVEPGGLVDIPIEGVNIGDLLEVHAGDSIPADGVVEAGASSVDQSLLTGESVPVAVKTGSDVSAGAVNLSGILRVRVQATGEATRVGRLMKLVEEGSRRRAPIVQLADRMASYFVVSMLTLSALTALVWVFIDLARAIDNAAALLIVTCPCALGLATPLAVTVAIGRAARRGILIKGGDAVQTLSERGTVFLDKTGTLTEGRMSLVRWWGDEAAKPLVAAIEGASSHPIARAIVRDLRVGPMPGACDIVQTVGGGIEGMAAGRHVLAGSPVYVRTRAIGTGMDDALEECLALGCTPVLVAVEGQIVGLAAIGDPIREDAKRSIELLREMGWNVRILSGDHAAIVGAAADQLGIARSDALGGATPEEKLACVKEASRSAKVVMVGDGINDAAALAAATVGIAVHGGAEASLAAADVYLSRPGLTPIVDVMRASRRTLSIIRINFGVAIFYNTFAATLAATGVINPIIAAVLMPISSLSVLTLSFKARTFGAETCL